MNGALDLALGTGLARAGFQVEAAMQFAHLIAVEHHVIAADDANPAQTHFAARQDRKEHTSELQSLMRISYAVFCLKKKPKTTQITAETQNTRHHTYSITATYTKNRPI